MRLSYKEHSLSWSLASRMGSRERVVLFVPLEEPSQVASAAYTQTLRHPRDGQRCLGTQLMRQLNFASLRSPRFIT